jgi:hypothetical protein
LFCNVKSHQDFEVSDIKDKILVLSEGDKQIGLIVDTVTSWPDDLKLNYLIVGKNSFRSLADINNKIKFDQLILTSDNNRYLVSEIKNVDVPIHSVARNGAFEIKF